MASESDDDVVSGSEEEKELDLSDQMVCTKYQLAAGICDKTMEGILVKVKVGANVFDLCGWGDKLITLQAEREFKSKKVTKGIAFPTCISVNETVCHFSPLSNESVVLKDGDVVKIDIGVHMDGYCAVLAHTVILQEEPQPVEGDLAKVYEAARVCSQVAHRLIRPGNKNAMVTSALQTVAETFGVNLLQGVLMHRLKRFVLDDKKCVIQREENDQKVADEAFEEFEAYAVDIALSTGDGKPRESEARTTVFKRTVDTKFRLKRKSSRFVFNEVANKYPTFPFSLRTLCTDKESTTQARAGVIECVKNDLLTAFPVLEEKEGSAVVHFKFTVLLLPSGTQRVTGDKQQLLTGDAIKCDVQLAEETKKVMAMSTRKKKKRRKKKKKKAAAADA